MLSSKGKPLPLQLRGECLEQFVTAAQDATKNAQSRSYQAAFNCWHEQLKADQTNFESELILTLSRIRSDSDVVISFLPIYNILHL